MKAYKFRSSSQIAFAFDIIINQRLFCADLGSLNDPMEGEFALTHGSAIRAEDVEGRLGQLKKAMNSYKVGSLTATFDSHLLWAHYGGGFDGVAIEIELPDNDPNIRAVKDRGVFDMLEIDKMTDAEEAAREILFTKYREWSYEKEIRILNKTSHFPISLPTKVIAGPRMLPALEKVLRIICEDLDIQFCRLGIGDDGLDADYVRPLKSEMTNVQ